MKSSPHSPLQKYLRTRAITAPWSIAHCDGNDFAGAVVIPSLAESDRLQATLSSLAANPQSLLDRFMVLIVVNHRKDATAAEKADNQRTLALLAAGSPAFARLRLGFVDAASPGLEMPTKGGGVGLARKIGLDLALMHLDWDVNPLLICLDGDTVVEPSYLPAILRHFAVTSAGGAAIPFRHQPGATMPEQEAIDRYELYLRHYLFGLKVAGSPYAFHTVGSAMACTAASYIKAGGMNTRTAGEDFYFLQHVARTAGVANVRGTTVHPSPRPSHRVPFGTGRSVSRWLAGENAAITFYRPECFSILRTWLGIATRGDGRSAEELISDATSCSAALADYLAVARFQEAWEGLRRNNPIPDRLISAFYCWFDGLKTMKLVHHLSAHGFPRCEPEDALPGLLRLGNVGEAIPEGTSAQLELLRKLEAEEETTLLTFEDLMPPPPLKKQPFCGIV